VLNKSGFLDKVTIKEACDILGIAYENRREKQLITNAHRTLVQLNHPDQGGSTYIAQKLNQAKEILIASTDDTDLPIPKSSRSEGTTPIEQQIDKLNTYNPIYYVYDFIQSNFMGKNLDFLNLKNYKAKEFLKSLFNEVRKAFMPISVDERLSTTQEKKDRLLKTKQRMTE